MEEQAGKEINADLSRLCVHTITTKPWVIEQAIDHYCQSGVRGITVWRDALEGRSPSQIGELIAHAGLTLVSLCRGGFFAASSKKEQLLAIESNLRAIEEAHFLGAPQLVLVCGADQTQHLSESRAQIRDGIAKILPLAEQAQVKLAVEPLHPMYADCRSAINTLKQANDLCDELNSPWLGVAVDVYHLWWDPDLEFQIHRCGQAGRIFQFHISDWKTPTLDLLNDRGLMGEGCIPIREIRGWAERSGFNGFCEVEIFSNRYWSEDQSQYLEKIVRAYHKNA
jgi:sugar phosphate isomerase/epimerase